MRRLSKVEQHKRGCRYCRLVSKERSGDGIFTVCTLDECLFHELDEHETYTDYLKVLYGNKGMKEILKEMGIYTCTKKENKTK